jgi:opacity protein-like surface antigen
MRSVKWFVIAAAILAAVPAWAQVDEKKINVNFGGGFTTSLSDIKDHVGNGYNFAVGLTINPAPKFGIQVEYSYNGLGEKQIDIPVSPTPGGSTTTGQFFGDANFHYIDFNAVLRPMGGSGSKANPYIIAGFGWYHRSIKVTTPSVGYVPGYCDPWWYVCYPGGFVPVDKILGSRSSDDWGINVGGGIDFKLGSSAAIYVEARYHYIWGPEVLDSTGKSYGKANGQFLPIIFGVRF